MTTKISIALADTVYEYIEKQRKTLSKRSGKKVHRSELIEEYLRKAILAEGGTL